MKQLNAKRVFSIVLALVMTFGLLPSNARAYEEPKVVLKNDEISLSQNQIEALDSILGLERKFGLVGFEDIPLDSDEMISVIVEFENMPAKVAETLARATGGISPASFDIKNYEALAAADRQAFHTGLNDIFGVQSHSRIPAAQPYEITWEYTTAINGVAMTLPASKVSALLEISGVYAVYPDSAVQLDPPSSSDLSAYGMAGSMDFLGVGELHENGYKGEGIVVGIIDSGVDYYHPDLINAFLDEAPAGSGGHTLTRTVNGEEVTKFFGWDFYSKNTAGYPLLPVRDPNDPMEISYADWKTYYPASPEIADNGYAFYSTHGTHVTGEIVGRGENTDLAEGYLPQLGIAPEANVIVYHAMGVYGSGLGSDILKAIDQTALDGCDVVNMSLGANTNNPYYITSIAVNNIILAYDIVFCVSAGNNGFPTGAVVPSLMSLGSPGTASLAITVAANSWAETDTAITATVGGKAYAQHLFYNDGSEFLPQEGGFYIIDYENLALNAEGECEYYILPNKGTGSMHPDIGIGLPSNYYDEDYRIYGATNPGGTTTKSKGDWEGELDNIAGKIVVIYRGGPFFYNMAVAKKHGAGGLLVINREDALTPNTNNLNAFRGAHPEYLPFMAMQRTEGLAFLEALKENGMKAKFTNVSSGNMLASFSSRGPVGSTYDIKPDLTAPGMAIYSTVPYYLNDHSAGPDDHSKAYDGTFNGTSMAAPHTAALAALLLGADKAAHGGVKTMKPAEVKARLMNSADLQGMDSGLAFSVNEVGAGRPNTAKAIDAEAYVTVRKDDVARRLGSQGSSQYELVPGDVASLSFGLVSLGIEHSKTLTATIHNTSNQAKTFEVSTVWNTAGLGVKYSPDLTIDYSSSGVTVGAGQSADFTATIRVPESVMEVGCYEGYVVLSSGEEIYRLPFSIHTIRDTGPILGDAFLNKPVISNAPANRQLYGMPPLNSVTSSLWFQLNRDGEGRIYLYVSAAEGFDPENPDFLGFINRYWNIEGQEATGNAYYTLDGFISGYYVEFVPGTDGAYIYDDYTYFDTGHYIISVCRTDSSGTQILEMVHTDLFVDNEPPEVAVTGIDTAGKSITGTISDKGLAEMERIGIAFEATGEPAGYTFLELVAVVNGTHYAEAAIHGDGTFLIDLGRLRTLSTARNGTAVTNVSITGTTPIVLYAFDSFSLQTNFEGPPSYLPPAIAEQYSDTCVGFDPAKASFRISNTVGYTGINMAKHTFKLGDVPSISLDDYGSLTLAEGESKALYPVLNVLGSISGDVVWSSDDAQTASVDQSGVITANGAGEAVITAMVGGVSSSLAVTVVENTENADVSAGVTLTKGDYVYYGALQHPTALTNWPRGAVTAREEAKTPVLWHVMGEEQTPGGGDGYTTLLSKYILDTSMFNAEKTDAFYKGSTIQRYLESEFLRTFSSVEDGNIPSFTVTTGYYPMDLEMIAEFAGLSYLPDLHEYGPESVSDQKVYIPWGKLYDTNPASINPAFYWSAGDYGVAGNRFPGSRTFFGAILKNGDLDEYEGPRMPKHYYLRTKTAFPGTPGVDIVYLDEGYDIAYMTNSTYGIRPITKIIPENVVYAYEVVDGGSQAEGTVPADETNYILPSDGKAYKLTVLGKDNGSAIGTLHFDASEVYDSGVIFSNLTSSQYGDDYVVAYKFVDGDGKIVLYGETATSSEAQTLDIALSSIDGLTAYIWLQKNNAVNSNEAGTVKIIPLAELKPDPVWYATASNGVLTVQFNSSASLHDLTAESFEVVWSRVYNVYEPLPYTRFEVVGDKAYFYFDELAQTGEKQLVIFYVGLLGYDSHRVELTIEPKSVKVVADIRGSAAGSLEAPVEYIISLLGMEKVLNASITFEVDGSMLEGKGLELLSGNFTALDLSEHGTEPIRWTNMGGGAWQGEILLMNFAADGFSSDVAVDIAKVIYAARKIGDATMKLTKLEVVGIDEHNQVVYLNSEIRTAEATTSIVKVYSIYDLNKDGVVDALDLGIVQRYYQSTMSSDNWDAAKACDFNNDGCVDIKDLIELFRQYAR